MNIEQYILSQSHRDHYASVKGWWGNERETPLMKIIKGEGRLPEHKVVSVHPDSYFCGVYTSKGGLCKQPAQYKIQHPFDYLYMCFDCYERWCERERGDHE